MNKRESVYILLITAVFFSTALSLRAQHTTDEFKRNLRKSLSTTPQLTPNLKHQPIEIEQYRKEKLEVSPETKLPTKFDRIEILNPIAPEKRIHINLTVTNSNDSLVMGKINYSDGKIRAIPNPRSIEQFTQYSGQGAVRVGIGDIDPVRAIQRYKAAQRKKKVDKILKAYGQETE